MDTSSSCEPLVLKLDLRDRRVVVVGGGPVAERKLERLLLARARPIVVAPLIVDAIRERVAQGRIRWFERLFNDGDCAGARLVVAATNDAAVNLQVFRVARRFGALAVVCDGAVRSGFSFCSTVQRGPLTFAVSSSGTAPALTATLRRDIARRYPPSWGRAGQWFRRLRRKLKRDVQNADERQLLWRKIMETKALESALSGDRTAFDDEVRRCICSFSD